MRRESHVRFCEGGGVRLPSATRPIWERKNGGRTVTFPARQYSVNGERRSFALLRPIVDTSAQDAARERILEAYAELRGGCDGGERLASVAEPRSASALRRLPTVNLSRPSK